MRFLLQNITIIAFTVFYDKQLLEKEELNIERLIFDILGKRIPLTPSADFYIPLRIILARLIEFNASEEVLAEGL